MPLLRTPRSTAVTDAAEPANGVDGAQVVFVALLGRQAVVQRDAQAGAVQSQLDVVRGQGVAGEQHVEVAAADQPADVLAAAGVDDGGAEHGQDFLAGVLRAAHGGGDLAHRHALGLLAGNRAGHELEQVLPGLGVGREDAQPLPADDDAVADAHVGHRQAAGGAALRIDEDAAVHFLIFHLDPLAVEANLGAVVGRAVKALREGAVHVGRRR